MTASLRFAANLKWLFAAVPLAERFDAAAAAGFTAVEVPDPYGLPMAQLQRRLTDAGLAPVLVNTPAGPAGSPTEFGQACLPDHVEEFRAAVNLGLDYAAAVGCPLLHIVAGRLAPYQDRERAMACYVDNIAWAAARARDASVELVLEMQNQRSAPGFLLQSQAEARAVAAAVGQPVGLLFDFFHTQVAEGDVTTVFDGVLPWIKHVQIGDAPGRTEPGTGELSWPFVFEHIRASGFDGWLGCEFQPAGPSEQVLARLGRLV
jgi:hydroxypyruvate isomerase